MLTKKIVFFILLTVGLFADLSGGLVAQESENRKKGLEKAGAVQEESEQLVGTAGSIKVLVKNISNPKTKARTTYVRLEYKKDSPFANITSYEIGDTLEVNQILELIRYTTEELIRTGRETETNITLRSDRGFILGAKFVPGIVVTESWGTPRQEKMYVTTTEKYYEGKQVNTDENGTYIWKLSLEPSKPSQHSGTWTLYAQLEENYRDAIAPLLVIEMNYLAKLLRYTKNKF